MTSRHRASMSPRRAAALLATLVLAVGLAACGGSSKSSSSDGSTSSASTGSGAGGNGVSAKSADAILQAATKAADSLKSVRVSGTVDDGGTQVGLDLQLEAGVGSKGSITLNGHKVELITLGHVAYLNGNSAFWKSFGGSAVAALLSGRWLKAPGSGSYADLVKLGNLSDLISVAVGSHGKLAKAGTKTVDGQTAIGVRDTTQGGTMYVATTGEPYPLELVGKSGTTGGKLDFTDFNAPIKVTAPAGAIDLGQLQSTS